MPLTFLLRLTALFVILAITQLIAILSFILELVIKAICTTIFEIAEWFITNDDGHIEFKQIMQTPEKYYSKP